MQGIKLGVSSRGWASLRTDPHSKCVYVDEDFELITFDFVTEPSTHGAYLVPIQKRYKRGPIPDQRKLVSLANNLRAQLVRCFVTACTTSGWRLYLLLPG